MNAGTRDQRDDQERWSPQRRIRLGVPLAVGVRVRLPTIGPLQREILHLGVRVTEQRSKHNCWLSFGLNTPTSCNFMLIKGDFAPGGDPATREHTLSKAFFCRRPETYAVYAWQKQALELEPLARLCGLASTHYVRGGLTACRLPLWTHTELLAIDVTFYDPWQAPRRSDCPE